MNWQETLLTHVNTINGYVWGWPLMIMLIAAGIYLTCMLGALQFHKLFYSLKLAFSELCDKKTKKAKGDISHFQALMTALSATVGTGNIAGVATAIAMGGPGAMVWMWLTGLLGMATKFTEGVLGIYYRRRTQDNHMSGGPMYYIDEGLGKFAFFRRTKLNKIMAVLFAVITIIAALNIGNMVQANSVADVVGNLSLQFGGEGISRACIGVVLALLTAAVILGGIKRIGQVTSALVPFMIGLYVLAGVWLLIVQADKLPLAFALIFEGAFGGTDAIAGGFAGAVVREVMRAGLSRGIFSNESGLGSSPIAAAAARTRHPVEQALVSMTQTFIDTLVVCTFTGLIIIVSGLWATTPSADLNGAALTAEAFGSGLNHLGGGFPLGQAIVAICLMFFAYSTLIGWSYYGERALAYLVKERGVVPYRLVYVGFVFIGAVIKLELAWAIADMVVPFMVVPNLIALVMLSPLVYRLTKDYFAAEREQRAYKVKPFAHDTAG